MSKASVQLEALLYADGGEMRKDALCDALGVSAEELEVTAQDLATTLQDRGLTLITTDTTLSLRTAQNQSKLIAKVQKKSLEKDIGDAGLEVLAIVLYKGGATKSSIDHIRGVNSAGTLRALSIRGLLERSRYEKDGRQALYSVSADALAHLGVTDTEELPEYKKINEKLQQFEQQSTKNDHGDTRQQTKEE